MNPQELQNLCDQYKAMVEAGSITKEEYLQLLLGINIMEGINEDAEGLQLKETLNTILNAAVAAASLMA
jgi:hypothetical protein